MTLLYVLPHAGGSAHAYVPLKKALEPHLEVVCCELPGRGKRAQEAPVSEFSAAVRSLQSVIAPAAGQPWALFGHSMGALLGHALVQGRHAAGGTLPCALVVSGTMAPRQRQRTRIASLPKEEFWSEVQRYGGMPTEILQVPEFRDYFELTLRHDFAALESAPAQPSRPLPVRTLVLYGHDEMTAQDAASWQNETHYPIEVHGFPGHHFFVLEQAKEVAALILQKLAGVACRSVAQA